MFGLFKKDPARKLEEDYKILMEKARDMQRSGDLKTYARMIAESEEMLNKIEALRKKSQ
ncbi:MAG: Lacal_2735 family protein [Lewinellaceae bacterium]|nr:Lacal_2735 family protein [Saprospiraceae bacterium]MCB9340536.1 Lacal_2735 family protein [Lewinellaceae bacterium]